MISNELIPQCRIFNAFPPYFYTKNIFRIFYVNVFKFYQKIKWYHIFYKVLFFYPLPTSLIFHPCPSAVSRLGIQWKDLHENQDLNWWCRTHSALASFNGVGDFKLDEHIAPRRIVEFNGIPTPLNPPIFPIHYINIFYYNHILYTYIIYTCIHVYKNILNTYILNIHFPCTRSFLLCPTLQPVFMDSQLLMRGAVPSPPLPDQSNVQLSDVLRCPLLVNLLSIHCWFTQSFALIHFDSCPTRSPDSTLVVMKAFSYTTVLKQGFIEAPPWRCVWPAIGHLQHSFVKLCQLSQLFFIWWLFFPHVLFSPADTIQTPLMMAKPHPVLWITWEGFFNNHGRNIMNFAL